MLKNKQREHFLISFSMGFYRFLLLFYPSRFRNEFGSHMAQVFRDACLDAYQKAGFLAMIDLWVLTLFDWIKSVIEEQLQRDTDMTREKFIRLSGWALILGAFSMGLGVFVQLDWIRMMLYRTLGDPASLAEYNRYRAMAENIGEVPGFAGLLLVVVGIHGLRILYREKVGKKGQLFLDLAFVGGMISITALFFMFGSGNTWWAFISGFVLMFSSLALFGIEAGRKGLLGHVQATLLLSGFWFPAWVVLSTALEFINGGKGIDMPNWIEMPIWALILAALILLGQTLQREAGLREPSG